MSAAVRAGEWNTAQYAALTARCRLAWVGRRGSIPVKPRAVSIKSRESKFQGFSVPDRTAANTKSQLGERCIGIQSASQDFGQAVAPQRAQQLRKLIRRLFSTQDLMASRALTPAFDQRHPALLNRLPTICLHALSATAGADRQSVFRADIVARTGFGSHIFTGMELVEDEGRFPADEGLLADIPGPCGPAGQHDQPFGLEQTVPEPEPLQAAGELRCPAGANRRLRAVDASTAATLKSSTPALELLHS